MKYSILTLLLLFSNLVSAQYFQRWLGTLTIPSKKHSFYDGLCTVSNFSGTDTSFFVVATGTSKLEMTDSAGLTKYDELRFARINSKGNNVFVNKGYAFKSDTAITDRWFNATGRSVAEMNTADHRGGYMVVGGISSNALSGATLSGGGDALIAKIQHNGTTGTKIHVDFKNGEDILYSVVASKSDSARFYACGTSVFSNSSNLIALKFNDKGKIYWARSYRLNISGGAYQTRCVGYSICESASGGELLIAGKINDPHNATGDDAILVKLNSSDGGFISAIAYQYAGDDSYRVIKTLSSGEYLIGGIAGSNGASSAMFMGRANITGTVSIHKTLYSVSSAGSTLATRCVDAVERFSTGGPNEFYFAGSRSSGATGSDAIVVKTDLSCNPAALYPYDNVGMDDAVAIDFSEATEYTAGLRLFSNTIDATASGKTDGYISRMYFNGATCIDYCPDDSFSLSSPLFTAFTVTQDTAYLKFKKGKLSTLTTDYSSAYLCNQASIGCGSNARAAEEEVKPLYDAEFFTLFPNPAGNSIRLSGRSPAGGIITLQIQDMLGRLLSQMNISAEITASGLEMDISNLEDGAYILTCKGDAVFQTIKFLKQQY